MASLGLVLSGVAVGVALPSSAVPGDPLPNSPTPAVAVPSSTTTVDGSVTFQTADGFGTSDVVGLLRRQPTTFTSGRWFWTLPGTGDLVRAGAVRIGATVEDRALRATAFRNTDGSVVVLVLNTSGTATTTVLRLRDTDLPESVTATPYLTNRTGDGVAQPAIPVVDGGLAAALPPRSLVTFRIPAGPGGSGAAVEETPTPTTTTDPATETVEPTDPTGPAVTVTPSPTVTQEPIPTPTETDPAEPPACSVRYWIPSEWTGAFQGSITITNLSERTLRKWDLTFTFPGDQEITVMWSAFYTQVAGAVTVVNAPENGRLDPGASVSPGFLSNWSGTNAAPTDFVLNGEPCVIV